MSLSDILYPGALVVCEIPGGCFCGCSQVSKGSIYTCEAAFLETWMHDFYCDLDECEGVTLFVSGKEHGFCINRFRPLNDGDTSLVADEEAEPIQVKEPELV